MFKFQAKSLEQDYMQTSGSALLKLMQNNDTPVLDLFVRESIQNSLDAALPDVGNVRVDFNYNEFNVEELSECYEEISAEINNKYKDKNKFISISDKNTIGLVGNKNGLFNKSESNQNLGKLVFQIMHAQTKEGSGGCWGIGKTVYYRLGQGFVIYYSRIRKEDGSYEERIISSLVEDDEKESRIIKKDGYLGITYFGEMIDNRPNVVCNADFIHKVLKIFGIKPYVENETGTIIIIPFIDEDYLLRGTGFSYEDKLFWDKNIIEYIKKSIVRWYFPRLNKRYSLGPILEAYINDDKVEDYSDSPVFEKFNDLYESIVTGEIKKGVQVKQIERKKDLKDSELGKFAFIKLSRSELKMSGSSSCYENYPSPFAYLNIKRHVDFNNPPIVAYCRKPGMIVAYETAGTWVGSGVSSGEDFIIGLFVLNSKNTIKDYNMSLEDYVRKSEKADHTSWTDPIMENKKQKYLVNQIMSEVGKVLKDTYVEKEGNTEEIITNRHFGKQFADLLPSHNYGKESSIDGRGRSSTVVSKNKSVLISMVGNPSYEEDGLKVIFDVNCKRKIKSLTFNLVVPTSMGNITLDKWEDEDSMPAIFQIKQGFIIFNECDNSSLKGKNFVLNGSDITLCEGCNIKYEKTKTGRIYKIKIINSSFSKCKFNLSLRIMAEDTKYKLGFETIVEEVVEDETI